jgi:hypothetical protein
MSPKPGNPHHQPETEFNGEVQEFADQHFPRMTEALSLVFGAADRRLRKAWYRQTRRKSKKINSQNNPKLCKPGQLLLRSSADSG